MNRGGIGATGENCLKVVLTGTDEQTKARVGLSLIRPKNGRGMWGGELRWWRDVDKAKETDNWGEQINVPHAVLKLHPPINALLGLSMRGTAVN